MTSTRSWIKGRIEELEKIAHRNLDEAQHWRERLESYDIDIEDVTTEIEETERIEKELGVNHGE